MGGTEYVTKIVYPEGERTVRLCVTILWLTLTALTLTAHSQEGALLRLVETIPLAHVEGRIDHLAVDLQSQLLFVAALGNNTVEVLDLKTGTHLRTITGLHGPQDSCSSQSPTSLV